MSSDRQPKILIIDNDEDLLRALDRRLDSLGYHCQTANSGTQGLSEFSYGDYDLIITDLNMPSLDGVGLVKKIREFSVVPVIIITGFRKEYASRLDQYSDITILRKPFEANQLIDLVTTELALGRTRKAG